ncbi:MAG: exodeoxyribonuclease VII large subunit [Ruminococcaceae bacterium]|nr:exodeoxyribonuclease VII large subunit [Oscillospiraceae bacterium]
MTLQNAISVTELNNKIKDLIDGDLSLKTVYVRGEISNYRPNTSGHMYFSLKDEGGVIRSVMFKGYASHLKFAAENGMKVIAGGYVSVFPRDGQYQLYIVEMLPDGVGELYLAFEQLKKRLEAEGLFDPAHKKPIPQVPSKIALVTSPTGAAIRDMLRILKKRWPLAKILVVPVKVQGEGAAAEIAAGIRVVNRKRAADLIITGRGGGSIEDLWCFNEEIVARAIYESNIPVISAVGHEPDFTIADFAADLRAATPSNGAELAVPDISSVYIRLDEISRSQKASVTSRIDLGRQRLKGQTDNKVMSSPMSYIDERGLYLDYISRRLSQCGERMTAQGERRFANLAAKLDALSPLKVLGRGYMIGMDESGNAVRKTADISPGDRLTLRLSDGSADCLITGVEQFTDNEFSGTR